MPKGGDGMKELFLEREEEVGPLINDQTFMSLAVLGLMAVAVILVVAIANWIARFQKELRRVNMRIQQAQSERERQHYIRRRRRLWLTMIPFVHYEKKHKHRHKHKHK